MSRVPGAAVGARGATMRIARLVCVAVNASIDKIAAVDRLVPGQIHRPELLSAVAGGKPINVARAASRLGLSVVVVPVVAGHSGSWLEASLARERITMRPVRVPGETAHLPFDPGPVDGPADGVLRGGTTARWRGMVGRRGRGRRGARE